VPLLQGLGYTGICTQNDTDPFLTGAFLSLPFVAGSFALTWQAARAGQPWNERSCRDRTIEPRLAGLAALVMLTNATLVQNTLLLGLSPCGGDHTEARFEPEHVQIGSLYGLPLLAVLVAALTAVRAALHGGRRHG
jgi:hypothetical protein